MESYRYFPVRDGRSYLKISKQDVVFPLFPSHIRRSVHSYVLRLLDYEVDDSKIIPC